jgi:hypothetical protein
VLRREKHKKCRERAPVLRLPYFALTVRFGFRNVKYTTVAALLIVLHLSQEVVKFSSLCAPPSSEPNGRRRASAIS